MPQVVMQQLLFGGEEIARDLSNPHLSRYQKFRYNNRYRWARCRRWSYECCATCRYSFKKTQRGKNYYKCEWMGCSSSSATDIALGRVCDKWEKEKETLAA